MKIDLDNAREAIQGKLVDYLQEQGVELIANGHRKFKCIIPEHNDKTPSANIIPGTNDREWRCHACDVHGDIFAAAHYLEEKPLDGHDFITDNVMYLAEKFNIELDQEELTEAEIRRIQTLRAYAVARQYIYDCETNDLFNKELEFRQWNAARVREFGVGQVQDFAQFTKHLQAQGFDAAFLESIDLAGSNAEWMFHPERMIFAVSDKKGKTIGFVARDLLFEKRNDPSAKKYKNTGTRSGVFKKSEVLYNLNNAIKAGGNRVYVFEGQADVITARIKLGLERCVCIGGTAFTEEHKALIQDAGFTNIVLALDGDEPGKKKTGQLVESLSGTPGLVVHVLQLPPSDDEKDIDAYVRKWGKDGWEDAVTNIQPGFFWQLQQLDDAQDKDEVIRKSLRSLVNEPDPMRRHRAIHEMSEKTDIPYDLLKSQFEHESDANKQLHQEKLQQLSLKAIADIRKHPESLPAIIHRLHQKVQDINETTIVDMSDKARQLDYVTAMEESILTKSADPGIMLGWPMFDDKSKGIPPEDTFMVLGGKANVGKTSMIANMAYRALEYNDNTIVAIMTIDDSYVKFASRILAAQQKMSSQWVQRPKMYDEIYPQAKIIERYHNGWNWIKDKIRDDRLAIQDTGMIRTWEGADRWIKNLRRDHPNKNILFLLDNFHLLQDYQENDGRQKYIKISNDIASSVKRHGIAMLTTVEYHKVFEKYRPENSNIAETVQIEYDCHLIMHMINYEHEFRKEYKDMGMYWEDTRQTPPLSKPIVELAFGKSKIDSFKGSIFYEFDPERSSFHEAGAPKGDESYDKGKQFGIQYGNPEGYFWRGVRNSRQIQGGNWKTSSGR